MTESVLQMMAADLDEIQVQRRCSFDEAVHVLINEENDTAVKENIAICCGMIKALRETLGADAI